MFLGKGSYAATLWRDAPESEIDWPALMNRLIASSQRLVDPSTGRILRRLKQWLSLAARYGKFEQFDAIKRAESIPELFTLLQPRALAAVA